MKGSFLKTGFSFVYYTMVFVIILVPGIASAQEANDYIGAKLTSSRAVSLLLFAVGIASVIIALRSKKRADDNSRKRGVIIASVLGLIAVILSAIRIAASTGFGTGGGKAGAILALLMGVIGIGLATRTFLQTRNNSKAN
jgi:formate-dependent nitrite reductase membrane component NrfD